MYVYHKDIPNNQWNVYKKENGQEVYVCSFYTLGKAQAYCMMLNMNAELRAEAEKMMGGG